MLPNKQHIVTSWGSVGTTTCRTIHNHNELKKTKLKQIKKHSKTTKVYCQFHWQMQESYKPQLKKNYIHVTLNLCWMTHLACFTHMSTQSLQTSHVSQAVHVSKHTFFFRPNKYLIPYHHGGIHINLIYNKEKKKVSGP